ncbi:hypothetical protein HYPSUDRAFT_203856 [Hypholoma sublateritium FD-334 SS-4]|uniref:Uncharacterized protein n=1 Tax=Hypholoma sublateritium (strain FD-334 SS-4) TaxID=945553 RepID=A0A0D2PK65_HYPSF|nr:hypothetical protein HYPSUDRAFT_203856 [Hypholoma sublateritium FD-334 SS-4]
MYLDGGGGGSWVKAMQTRDLSSSSGYESVKEAVIATGRRETRTLEGGAQREHNAK